MFDEVKAVVVHSLQLNSRAAELGQETRLLGNLPELDSMAVVTLITALEERFGIYVADDDVSAETFETMGSLVEFVQTKLESET